eukprot:7379739-Prymnesium_polylepis.1
MPHLGTDFELQQFPFDMQYLPVKLMCTKHHVRFHALYIENEMTEAWQPCRRPPCSLPFILTCAALLLFMLFLA